MKKLMFLIIFIVGIFYGFLLYRSYTVNNSSDFQGEERAFASNALGGAKGFDALSPLSTAVFRVTKIDFENDKTCPNPQWSKNYQATVEKYTWYGKLQARFIVSCDNGVIRQ